MTTATISRTNEYLVIKIPLRQLKRDGETTFSSEDEKAVKEGLRAIAEGRVSKPLKTKREILSFLENL